MSPNNNNNNNKRNPRKLAGEHKMNVAVVVPKMTSKLNLFAMERFRSRYLIILFVTLVEYFRHRDTIKIKSADALSAKQSQSFSMT